MKSSLKNISLLLLLCGGLFPCSAHAAKDNLLALFTLAKAKDPAVGRARAQLDVSRADTDIAMSQMMPRIDANASVNWIESTTINYAPDPITGSFTGDGYGVGLRLPIFQLPAVFGLSSSRAAERAADANLTVSRQDLLIQLADSYFALLKARVDETHNRSEQKRYAKLLEQAQTLQQAGTGDIIAVFDAKARLENASTELLKAENQVKQAAQSLGTMAGKQVAEVMDLGPYQPEGPTPSDLQWWLDIQQKQHPALRHARETVAQNEFAVKAAKAGHLPVLQASAGYTVSKGSTFLPQVETRQWYAGFNISLPLYSGGETEARTRRARAQKSDQEYVLNDTTDKAIQKLKQLYLELTFNASLIASLGQNKAVMTQQLEAVKAGYDAGTRTVAELVSAEQSLAAVQRDLTKSIYDNALRSLTLKYAAGTLNETDLITLNSKLTE